MMHVYFERLTLFFTNFRSQIIQKTVVKLLQTIVYKAEGHEETIYTTIVEREKGGVYPGDSEIWKDSTMRYRHFHPLNYPDVPT